MTLPTAAAVAKASGLTPLVIGIGVLCVLVLFATVYEYGRAIRAASQLSDSRVIQQEDHGFCLGLGLADKSEAYAQCTSGLTAIRQRQRERFDAESAGIL